MNSQGVSLISTLVNVGLGIAKLVFGFMIGSMALVADGVHSSLDVLSSFVTFLGLRTASKPADEKHPYGHFRAESLAGFFVSLLLAITGLLILYEAIKRFFGEQPVRFSLSAIIVVIVSILATELMARLKFYYGKKERSLSLIADAEHSRADVISSIGVLIGLFVVRYFNLADAIVALGIGGYILFEAFGIGKEISDSLLDVSDKNVEERIRKICQAHNVEISSIKTRKIGAFDSAEIRIKLPPKLKVEEVQKITDTLEERFLSNIPELKQIVISVEAYELTKNIIISKFGGRIGDLKGFERIGPKKLGKRTIIPLNEKKEINYDFGSKNYLVLDKRGGKIVTRKIVENPYFEANSPHGTRFAKAIRADKTVTYQIGPNARQSLENFGIQVEIIPEGVGLEETVKKIEEEKN